MNTKQNTAAVAFLKQVQKDELLRQQIDQIKVIGPTRIAEIVRIAEAEGFSFTVQEYEETIRAQSAMKSAKTGKMAKECASAGGSIN
jgi:predicted ribosomally synthesized peptide with nif11-like leader